MTKHLSSLQHKNYGCFLYLICIFCIINCSSLFGNSYAVAIGSGKMSLIDIINPEAPILVSEVNVTGQFVAITPDGNYAFTVDLSGEVKIVDITNVYAPAVIGSLGSPSDFSAPAWIVFTPDQNYAFLSNFGGAFISVFDISNIFSPTFVMNYDISSVVFASYGMALTRDGRYLFVFSDSSITSIDVTDPINPQLLDSVFIPGGTLGGIALTSDDDYLLVPNDSGSQGIVLDVSHPNSLNFIEYFDLSALSQNMFINPQSTFGFATFPFSGTNAVGVIDLSNPTTPTQTNTISMDGTPDFIAFSVNGNYMVTASSSGQNISITQIIDPNAPVPTSVFSLDRSVVGVAVTPNPLPVQLSVVSDNYRSLLQKVIVNNLSWKASQKISFIPTSYLIRRVSDKDESVENFYINPNQLRVQGESLVYTDSYKTMAKTVYRYTVTAIGEGAALVIGSGSVTTL